MYHTEPISFILHFIYIPVFDDYSILTVFFVPVKSTDPLCVNVRLCIVSRCSVSLYRE